MISIKYPMWSVKKIVKHTSVHSLRPCVFRPPRQFGKIENSISPFCVEMPTAECSLGIMAKNADSEFLFTPEI